MYLLAHFHQKIHHHLYQIASILQQHYKYFAFIVLISIYKSSLLTQHFYFKNLFLYSHYPVMLKIHRSQFDHHYRHQYIW